MSIFLKTLQNAKDNTIENTDNTQKVIGVILAYCNARHSEARSFMGMNGEETVYRMGRGEYVHVYYRNSIVDHITLVTV